MTSKVKQSSAKKTAQKKLKIGITVGVEANKNISTWSSGAWQNIIFLYYLLKESNQIESVRLINYAFDPASTLPVSHGVQIQLHQQHDVVEDIDVLIVMGIQIGQQVQEYQKHGAKVVAFHVGNHYIITLENILFDLKRGGGDVEGVKFDAVWTLPHHYKTCRDFFAVTNHAPCYEVPYLWNPIFIEDIIQKNNLQDLYQYQGHTKEKQNIVVFEPNMNVVKSSVYPMLISELAYRQAPEKIKNIHVTNTVRLHPQAAFNQFAGTLSMTHAGVASYDDRYDTPSFMSHHGDIVITHQWENGLNNLYFDLLYKGYPLVHNSPFLEKAGYYYPEFDAQEGAKQVLKALSNHNPKDYKKRSDAALAAVDIYNPKNIKAYEDALFNL
jgi:hypothetical protein